MQFTYTVTEQEILPYVRNIVKQEPDIESFIHDVISQRLAAYQNILDGVSLEELTNFDVPLLSAQTEDEKHDGVLLGYKDGKLVEEIDLNGGQF